MMGLSRVGFALLLTMIPAVAIYSIYASMSQSAKLHEVQMTERSAVKEPNPRRQEGDVSKHLIHQSSEKRKEASLHILVQGVDLSNNIPPARVAEYIETMRNNLAHPFVKHIHLFWEVR